MRMIEYKGFYIEPFPTITNGNRYSIAVRITDNNMTNSRMFYDYEKNGFILEIEAEKESINLAKNLIDRGLM